MDLFQYEILIKKIDTLSTKKAKLDIFKNLIDKLSYYEFKALTYLLFKYADDLPIGTSTSDKIKKKLAYHLKDSGKSVDEITEFCNTDFTVSEFHFDRLIVSRYTTYQMLAYAAKHIKVK